MVQNGTEPLSEPMMISLLTHICVTRPQWVKKWRLVNFVPFTVSFIEVRSIMSVELIEQVPAEVDTTGYVSNIV